MQIKSGDDFSWHHAIAVTRSALLLMPASFICEITERLDVVGVVAAVADHDTTTLFDWVVDLLARQGISNHSAITFAARNGSPSFAAVSAHMSDARCPRLRSYWHYAGCGYRRTADACGTPQHRLLCPVTLLPARKGALAEAAIGLWLFIRDVCGGDVVGWIDQRLAASDRGSDDPMRAAHMRAALLEPLVNIPGTGPKVWAMILAELLLGADPARERWVTAGASFVAVDSLVHAFLQRTGILRRLGCEHAYGSACYDPGGCRDVVHALADRIDARAFNPTYPQSFPRWVQFAIWQFCAAGSWNICNGNTVDDRYPCRQRFCPAWAACDRNGG